jgi:hypothetical protein
MSSQIAVVGGGVAGLCATLEACDASADITLFERTNLLGGRVIGGPDFDTGRHLITTAYHDFLWLTDQLGSTHSLSLRPQAYASIRKSRLLWWRLGSWPGPAARLISSPLLPIPHRTGGLMAFGRGLLAAPEEPTNEALLGEPGVEFVRTDGPTLAEYWSLARWPRTLTDRFGEAVCRGSMNAAPNDAAAAPFLTALKRTVLERERLAGWVRGDWGAPITDPAPGVLTRRGIDLRLGTAVESVRELSHGWAVTANGETQTFNGVILAIPPQQLSLLERSDKTAQIHAAAGNVTGNTIITVRACIDTIQAQPGPIGESQPPYSIWFAEPHPDGGVLVEQVLSAQPDDQRPELATLRKEFRSRALRLFSGTPATEPEVRYTPSATPILVPGTPRPNLRIAPGLWYAGDWSATGLPATLESAARSGRLAGRDAGRAVM